MKNLLTLMKILINSKKDNIILLTLIGKIVNLFVFNEFEKKSMIISMSITLKNYIIIEK